MRTLLILVSSIILSGCAIGSMPAFPDEIKEHYMTEVKDEEIPSFVISSIENLEDISPMELKQVVRCLKFEVVSKIPYKIKFISEVPMKECHAVGGFKPANFVSLSNWITDVAEWAETRKKCFR